MVTFPWSRWFIIMTLNNASSYFVNVIHIQAVTSQMLFLCTSCLTLRLTDV